MALSIFDPSGLSIFDDIRNIALTFNDDVALKLGTGGTVSILYETADANANALIFAAPEGGSVDVPVFIFGDASIVDADLTFFNGITEPSIAIIDDDKSAYLLLGFYANNQPAIRSANSITLMPSGDVDDYFTFATVGGIPTIYGTGSYTRFGDAGTASIVSTEDDVMFSGAAEYISYVYFRAGINLAGFTNISFMIGDNPNLGINAYDADALQLSLALYPATGNYVETFTLMAGDTRTQDLGLFDGITQPTFVVLEKAGQLHSATDGIADAGAATAVLKHTGGFTNAVVGDIVRITAGTNCTAGWYWITTVTSADQVTLDRNYASNDATNVTFVTFHNFPMIGADGVKVKVFDGAPGDTNTEIDIDGWVALDVSQANGRLYWRANNAWHYVDATA